MAERYTRGRTLGEGTWGQVYEATRKDDGLRVAIKRMRGNNPQFGLDFTALREIKYLQEIKGTYIENLVEVYLINGLLHLVLEFCPFDLKRVIYDKSFILRTKHIKCYMTMLMKAIQHCHAHFVLHRDLTPANILFNCHGILKLADFGLARGFGSPLPCTAEVVTRAYRAPELLFGARFYGEAIDMWSVGCIFAEVIIRTILFPGETDLDQLGKIFNVTGTPTDENWPGAKLLPAYVAFEHRDPLDLRPLFTADFSGSEGGVSADTPVRQDHDLLLKLLTLNPSERYNASQALEHPYFSTGTSACTPEELPVPANCYEYMDFAPNAAAV